MAIAVMTIKVPRSIFVLACILIFLIVLEIDTIMRSSFLLKVEPPVALLPEFSVLLILRFLQGWDD